MYYIYRITNKVNGKTYIGQHKYKKLNDSYMGSGILLAKAKKKYGKENFEKEIIYSRIQYKETADDMERFVIAKERAKGKAEYNLADGGGGISGYHFHLSDETKKKMSEYWKGKQFSEETKKRISDAKRGKPRSEDTKKKLSESHKGQVAWNKGKPWSEEMKQRFSEAKKGKHWKLVDGKRVWY